MPEDQGQIRGADDAGSPHGVVVAGLDAPAMIDELIERNPPGPAGFASAIFVVEPDATKARALLGSHPALREGRVRVFSGPACADELLDACAGELDRLLPRRLLVSAPAHVGLAKRIASGLDALVKAQHERTGELRRTLAHRWAQRGDTHWGDRFAQIRAGAPARFLVITTRFSTYMKTSAEDLALALVGQGHDAQVLLEPSEQTTMMPLLCLGAIDQLDPDLIVVINYPRALHRDLFPDGWPHVCWIQDAMAHLFKPCQTTPTPLDFLAGHIYDGAAGLEGYPESRTLSFPVPVSESKFHPAPVQRALSDRFACDIAYVSHQSQTPGAFHSAFIAPLDAQKITAFDACFAQVSAVIDAWKDAAQYEPLVEARRDLASKIGGQGNTVLNDMLWNQYIHPLTERLLRHETLGWAAAIATKHNLSFKVFGKGWDAHPTLGPFASPPLAHGEELRACYQSATVHLHASMHGCGHQRVFECAFSGGLPLCRRNWGELQFENWLDTLGFIQQRLPYDACLVEQRWGGYVIDRHPELASILEQRSRLAPPQEGWDHDQLDDVYAINDDRDAYSSGDKPIPEERFRSIRLLGDPLSLTFSTREDLEERVLRAATDPRWRAAQSSGIAHRASGNITMSSFARKLVEMTTNALAAEPAPPARPELSGANR